MTPRVQMIETIRLIFDGKVLGMTPMPQWKRVTLPVKAVPNSRGKSPTVETPVRKGRFHGLWELAAISPRPRPSVPLPPVCLCGGTLAPYSLTCGVA